MYGPPYETFANVFPTSGTGSATISYSAGVNSGQQPRSASLIIGNGVSSTTFTMLQAGTSGSNFTPVSFDVSPFVGSANSQTFTAIYSDLNGALDLDRVWLLFNVGLSGQNGCFVEYSRTDNVFRLRNDADNGWLGATPPGGFPSLQNSACEINVNQSFVILAGNQLTINIPVLFKPAFAGKRNIYLAAFDRAGVSSDWTCFGTWYPGPVVPQQVNRYRLFLPWASSHLHTTDLNEYTYLGSLGYPMEGVSGSVFSAPATYQGVPTTPIYRILWGEAKQHLWTTDRADYVSKVRDSRQYYLGQGVDGFFVHEGAANSFPLYRLVNCCPGGVRRFHWTQDVNEYNTLTRNGWLPDGVAGYMLPAQ